MKFVYMLSFSFKKYIMSFTTKRNVIKYNKNKYDPNTHLHRNLLCCCQKIVSVEIFIALISD